MLLLSKQSEESLFPKINKQKHTLSAVYKKWSSDQGERKFRIFFYNESKAAFCSILCWILFFFYFQVFFILCCLIVLLFNVPSSNSFYLTSQEQYRLRHAKNKPAMLCEIHAVRNVNSCFKKAKKSRAQCKQEYVAESMYCQWWLETCYVLPIGSRMILFFSTIILHCCLLILIF